jgi:hypothetical protein
MYDLCDGYSFAFISNWKISLLLVLQMLRLLCPLGCFAEASLSVSWLWKRFGWKRSHKETDIITWSWLRYDIFSVAGAWVSLWLMISLAHDGLKGCIYFPASYKFLCYVLFVLSLIFFSLWQDEGKVPHLYVELDFKEVQVWHIYC